MSRGVDIFNLVRQESSGQFKQFVPSAAEDNVANVASILFNSAYQVQLNEFVSNLINRISLTIVRNKSFNNPLAMFKKGAVPLGTDIQDIYTNPAEAQQYSISDTEAQKLLTITDPDTKVAYYSRNRQDRYEKTISKAALQAAFVSWDKFEEYVTSIAQALYSAAYIDEFKLTKELVDGAYANDKVITLEIDDPTVSEANSKKFIKKVRALYTKMQLPSKEYNAYSKFNPTDTPITTWTENSRMVFITTADIMATIDVDVLAAAFNMDKANFMGRVVIVDGFKNEGIYGVIADESWLQIYDNLFQMEEFYNARVMAWNQYLHVWGTFAICPFANAVMLVGSKAVPVTAVTIADQSVAKGANKTVTPTLTPSGATSKISKVLSSDEQVVVASAASATTIKIEGKSAGSATVKVVYDTGLKKEFGVTVTA